MYILLLLLGLPLLFAVLVLFAKNTQSYKLIMRLAAGSIIAATILCAIFFYDNTYMLNLSNFPMFRYAVSGIILLIALYIIYSGIKSRSFLIPFFAVLQIGFIAWLQFFSGHSAGIYSSIYVDKLTWIMIMIVGLAGSLICLHSTGYMKDYHERYPEKEDQRTKLFSALLVGLFAAFGFIISNDLVLMLLFLQITSLCSFSLIGYTKSTEAVKNSITTLTVNVLGDLSFATGIFILAFYENVHDWIKVISLDSYSPLIMTAILLIVCAGLIKSAQLPFSKWLLDATSAETPMPVSAMLHAVTTVNIGVYLIIRFTPVLGQNAAGISVTFVGGLTFLIAAALAGSRNDAKRVLAYSTISTMGLIIVCAGISTPGSLWAAIMLLILHTIAKSLLFLSFGTAAHSPGNRNVEHMRGMHGMSMRLAMLLIVGMAGMLVAPFVMIISRWTVMQAFMDAGNLLIVVIIAFGSTLTLFYWTKWIGKLIAHTHFFSKEDKYPKRPGEKIGLYALASLVIIVCMLYPLVSDFIVVPFIRESMMADYVAATSLEEFSAIFLMLAMLLIIPIILIPYFKKYRTRQSPTYLAGVNAGDDLTYHGAMGQTRRYELRNQYMITFTNEHKFLTGGYVICLLIIIGGFFASLGGAII